MLTLPENRQKLVPLRRFACKGLYSCSYLSQLVQRKKLKATKVGRNYFTTRQWFEIYLDRHANDNIRRKYKQVLNKPTKYRKLNIEAINQARAVNETKARAFNLKKLINVKTIVVSATVVFLLFTGYWLMNEPSQEQGQVAGVEETATSTIENNIDMIYFNGSD